MSAVLACGTTAGSIELFFPFLPHLTGVTVIRNMFSCHNALQKAILWCNLTHQKQLPARSTFWALGEVSRSPSVIQEGGAGMADPAEANSGSHCGQSQLSW